MVRSLYILLAFVSLGALIPAQAGLIIDPTFDSSITSQGDAAGIEATINEAIHVFEATYSNPITVSIVFQAGGGLGESQVGSVYEVPYSEFYSALVANDANPAAIAGLTANGGASTKNPVNNTDLILVKSANARALGLTAAPLCTPVGTSGSLVCGGSGSGAVDGIISLNTNITYPPQPDGGTGGNTYGLESTAEHEIDEVLGLGSALPDCNDSGPSPCTSASSPYPDPEDLFRYTGPDQFASINVNCADTITPAYFSYTGATDITDFNTACNGADWADWSTGSSPQVQDAFGQPGEDPAYGANEIAAMSAIGYTLAAPEPGTWILMLASFGLLAGARKRLLSETR